MTLSKFERQKVLDIIYSSLSNPNASGNRFLWQLLNNAKDGFFNLNLLKGLVTELKDYPLAYLQHCINYERMHHPDQQRLELDSQQLKVRIARQIDNTATARETDPFGFLVKSSSTLADDTGKKRQRTPSPSPSTTSSSTSARESDPLQKKQRRSSGSSFTPYRPSFNFKSLADDEESMHILPVFYDDGKFYQDASFFSTSIAEKATKETPSYDKLDILPIGANQTMGGNSRSLGKEKTCWNCGLSDHELPDCPEPTNRQQIEVNRALFLTGNGSGGGRYYDELVYKDHVSGLEPGRLSANLRDALGMYHYDDEPPYYRAMRKHGYPPGYTGSYVDQERVMKLVGGNQLDDGVPDLQIFNTDQGGDDEDKNKPVEQEQKDTQALEERIRMVTYPGLYRTQEISRHNQQQPNIDQIPRHQQRQYHQQQQQYYQQSSYQQYQYQQPSYKQQHYQQEQQQYYQHASYQQYRYEESWNYDGQQAYPSQHEHQYQASSSYYQQYPQPSYHTSYSYEGQHQAYHHSNPGYTPYNNDQQAQLYKHSSMSAPSGIYNDQPPPPPPSSSLGSLDDDIPPPPPPSSSLDDDIPPPPPPSNSLDIDIPPPPPPSCSLDNTPPPPPSIS